MYRLLQLEYCKRSIFCAQIVTFYGTAGTAKKGEYTQFQKYWKISISNVILKFFCPQLLQKRQSRRRKEEKHFEPAANRSNLMITFGCSLWPLTQATAAVAVRQKHEQQTQNDKKICAEPAAEFLPLRPNSRDQPQI